MSVSEDSSDSASSYDAGPQAAAYASESGDDVGEGSDLDDGGQSSAYSRGLVRQSSRVKGCDCDRVSHGRPVDAQARGRSLTEMAGF